MVKSLRPPQQRATSSHHRSTPAEAFPLNVQEVEENFDLALVASLETNVVPYLGAILVPDLLASQLAQILHQGSRLYEDDTGIDSEVYLGKTEDGRALPRERFSYWCFDLLFLICSDSNIGTDIGLFLLAVILSESRRGL